MDSKATGLKKGFGVSFSPSLGRVMRVQKTSWNFCWTPDFGFGRGFKLATGRERLLLRDSLTAPRASGAASRRARDFYPPSERRLSKIWA